MESNARLFTLLAGAAIRWWLARVSGTTGWVVLEGLDAYRPRPGDVVFGCFTVSQCEALDRLGVCCLSPRVDGIAVPDEATALRCLPSLELGVAVQTVLAPRARRMPVAEGGVVSFHTGPGALLAAVWKRSATLRTSRRCWVA